MQAAEPPLSTFNANHWIPQQLDAQLPQTYGPSRQNQLDDWNNNGTRLPRPSLSRNVSEITHGGDSSDSGVCGGGGGGGDAMVAVIADSTMSSSEERFSSSSPAACSRKTSSSIEIQPYQVLPYDANKSNPNPASSITTMPSNASNSLSGGDSGSDGGGVGCDGDSGIVGRVTKRDFSPTVLKDTITTGAYRYSHNMSTFIYE